MRETYCTWLIAYNNIGMVKEQCGIKHMAEPPGNGSAVQERIEQDIRS